MNSLETTGFTTPEPARPAMPDPGQAYSRPALDHGRNHWGKLGQWQFHVCRNPQVFDQEIAFLVSETR